MKMFGLLSSSWFFFIMLFSFGPYFCACACACEWVFFVCVCGSEWVREVSVVSECLCVWVSEQGVWVCVSGEWVSEWEGNQHGGEWVREQDRVRSEWVSSGFGGWGLGSAGVCESEWGGNECVGEWVSSEWASVGECACVWCTMAVNDVIYIALWLIDY